MKLHKATTIAEVRQAVSQARRAGQNVALVPTMGALHAGHISLIRAARTAHEFVVVSIFVNPTQFGPNEDFASYPRDLENDLDVCVDEGVTLVFAPGPDVVYPQGFRTYVEVTQLQDGLCGAFRPSHFRGVATVVLKLLNIVQPDAAYFGQKDAQQARIIQQMAQDLNVHAKIVVCPTVREPDGLAMSSRNKNLGADQRRHAAKLYGALLELQDRVTAGERNTASLVKTMQERLAAIPGARVDYTAVVDAASLLPVERLESPALAALAVRFGSTRLIDNVLLEIPNPS